MGKEVPITTARKIKTCEAGAQKRLIVSELSGVGVQKRDLWAVEKGRRRIRRRTEHEEKATFVVVVGGGGGGDEKEWRREWM